MQTVNSIETYEYEIRKDPVSEKEVIKCNNIIKWLFLLCQKLLD